MIVTMLGGHMEDQILENAKASVQTAIRQNDVILTRKGGVQ